MTRELARAMAVRMGGRARNRMADGKDPRYAARLAASYAAIALTPSWLERLTMKFFGVRLTWGCHECGFFNNLLRRRCRNCWRPRPGRRA